MALSFAVVPANASLDLKALARLTGDRKVDTVALKEVTPLTGYVRGGVTALGAEERLSGVCRRDRRALRGHLGLRWRSRDTDCPRSSRLPSCRRRRRSALSRRDTARRGDTSRLNGGDGLCNTPRKVATPP